MGALFFILILAFVLADAEINNARPKSRPDHDDPRRTIEDDIDELLEKLRTWIKKHLIKK